MKMIKEWYRMKLHLLLLGLPRYLRRSQKMVVNWVTNRHCHQLQVRRIRDQLNKVKKEMVALGKFKEEMLYKRQVISGQSAWIAEKSMIKFSKEQSLPMKRCSKIQASEV